LTLMIKVALVDDHPVVVNGLAELLKQQAHIEVAGAFTQAHELYALLTHNSIDVLILDINMPGIDGFDVMQFVNEEHPEIKTLVLTMLNDGHVLRRIVDAGANGYIEKNASQHKILEAIEAVHLRGSYLDNESSKRILKAHKEINDRVNRNEGAIDISKREKEVIQCILNKMKNEKIAETLFITENTVRSHKKNIFRKFNVGNTSELIIEIHKQGLSF